MDVRVCGTETEYGCLIESDDLASDITPEALALLVKDQLFSRPEIGILDVHYRDWGEPPGNGGFLFNGGRLYIDMGHVEYATPECLSFRDVVAYERAADMLLVETLDEVGLRDGATFVRNNIDHATGATFGYHENYLVNRDTPFYKEIIPALLPFLITRQIYTGAGRVGFHEDEFWEDEPHRPRRIATQVTAEVPYQLSQRADHIVTEAYQWVQFSRAIINTRDEPLADSNRFRRIHLLLGDTNMAEYASALKIGTTMLVLALIEEGCPVPSLPIENAVFALRHISRDSSYRWQIPLETGRSISAVEVQGAYLALAERYLAGLSGEFDWVIEEWRSTLEALATDPMLLKDRVDWVTKRWLLETFMNEERLDWDDPWLQSIDLEYHKVDPRRGLYHELAADGMVRRVVTDRAIENAMTQPPPDTRAMGRSSAMRHLAARGALCVIEWDSIYLENGELVEMRDPFLTYESIAERIRSLLSRPSTQDRRHRRRRKRARS